ncbi:hypothetical protein jhhlp_002958 [Lomentospora prolificans]|uniref:Heterokaryon incompatibility domain-containing protein n=1 Tax=Lomentospora prolificans TaxID=41688 RepID=A0A2N3NFM7_9PEZI|nr:hypothetical protein jhhlp_002958 [Lomentospora prolificans]
MRLLHISTLELRSFLHADLCPPYIAVSRRWQEGQVSYSAFLNDRERAIASEGFSFVTNACQIAKQSGFDYLWIYSLCVDESSSAEVSEAAISSFDWLRRCHHLIAHLEDLPPTAEKSEPDEAVWASCSWFSRCWTLPELLAPAFVHFYDRDWSFRGCKTSGPVRELISRITHIADNVLCDSSLIPHVSSAKRMSWASNRSASKEEDKAYSLMGIFDVSIPILYGEGPKAFLRLMEEILRNSQDLSLLLWDAKPGDPRQWRGIFASSPAEYWRWISCPPSWSNPLIFQGDVVFTSKGMFIWGHYLHNPQSRGRGLFLDLGSHDGTPHRRAVLMLFRLGDSYVRPAVGAAVSLATENMKNATRMSAIVKRDIDLKLSTTASNMFQLPLMPIPTTQPPDSRETRRTTPQHPRVQVVGPVTQASSRIQSPQCDDRLSTESSVVASESCAFSLEAKSIESESYLGISRRHRKRSYDLAGGSPPTQKRTKLKASYSVVAPEQSHPRRLQPLVAKISTEKEVINAAFEDDSADSEEYHALLEESEVETPPVLEADHEFRSFVYEICQESLKEFSIWKNDKLRFIIHEDSSIEACPLVPAVPRFACPLYLANTDGYRTCMTRCELLTIREVQRHLATHRLPPYCPVCYETFDRASARDEHIVRRECKLRAPPTSGGISEEQLRQIASVPSSLVPEERWYALWDKLYHDKPRPPSPYLPDEVGLEISLMRDFWAEQGQLLVSGFLKSRDMLSWHMPAEERSLSALYYLVLDRLIDGLYDQYESSSYVCRDRGTRASEKPGSASASTTTAGVWKSLIRGRLPLQRHLASKASDDRLHSQDHKVSYTAQPSDIIQAETLKEVSKHTFL